MSDTPKKTPMSGKERARRFREKNKEKAAAHCKAWYERNREEVLKKRAEERLKRKELQKEREVKQREEAERMSLELEKLKLLISRYGIQV
ncbi:conserved hypothetical protein [Lausannevirus]|uniref:Uncharacterized protein n=2 Tax=Lausannevirus TaxID=999883 RepID=A0A0N9Q0K3_9VIRU|nr:hypothetical protein LAU_0002 [Lausannevirus]AEA06858.1 conserved hypothetical protein [Lausannevirus]ALH06700.1 hypothetical protein PMV_002 [Port-miou virus]